MGISPQIYEMDRLLNFTHLSKLREFAKHRQRLGTERLVSTRINCRDAVLFVLPGLFLASAYDYDS